MERNDDFNSQNAGMGGVSGTGNSGAGSSSFGAGSATSGSDVGSTVGSDFSQSASGVGQEGQSRLQQVKGAAADKFGTVKEKVSGLNATLADKLEAGADKLRQRNQGAQFAGTSGAGTTGAVSDARLTQVNDKLATGMQNTADWLRNGDLQQSIEGQVRTNPGRTLLIALGLGYVLGKAFRK